MWLNLIGLLKPIFSGRIWVWVVSAIAIGALYAYARHVGSASRQPEVDGLAAQVKAVRDQFDAAASKWNAERADWDKRVARLDADLVAATARAAADLESDRRDSDRRLASALERMRQLDAALGIAGRALKHSSAAPAECRQFEADARLLPGGDRELLIRLGDAADRVVLERNICVSTYNALVERFNLEGQHK